MRSHPGGDVHTRRMLELAALRPGERVLDLGAGAGEALSLLRALGYDARGIDLEPRSPLVERGDLLDAPFPDGSFGAVLSQCAFFASGDQRGALREARRLLRPGGSLLLSDVFFEDPAALLREAGFAVLRCEDMTKAWREHYLEALWREDAPCCEIPRGKCSYQLLIGRKD
ncbi:MAG: methyltransferase domain-containing protein [Oscillospiraceae bacterium]|nr:methyltransferase domain-containing protein [Oscillospiraceae bacterium]